jgi:hypothetical protein
MDFEGFKVWLDAYVRAGETDDSEDVSKVCGSPAIDDGEYGFAGGAEQLLRTFRRPVLF